MSYWKVGDMGMTRNFYRKGEVGVKLKEAIKMSS
jgi:hypothetical protein